MKVAHKNYRFLKFLILFFLCANSVVYAKVVKIKDLKRKYDPVIITGDALRVFSGKPLANMRLYSYFDGKFQTVPFQFDEKNENSSYVLEAGDDKTTDESPGILDKSDEFVFMAWDTGNQVSMKEFPPGFAGSSEIEVRDPDTNEVGFVYLLFFEKNPPPLSMMDYVQYDQQKEEVSAYYYGVKFSEDAPLCFDSMALKKVIGGDEKNTIDRLKIRFSGKLILGLHLAKNEEDFKTTMLGYKDGPVRLIRRTETKVVFYGIFKSPSAVGDELFYGNFFYFPFMIDFPFDVKTVFQDAKMRLTTEMSPDTTMIYYNSNNLKGLTVDGVMSDEEKNMNKAPFTWAVVKNNTPGNTTAFLNMPVISESVPVQPTLYYVDDETLADPPEEYPGQRGNLGYELDNFQWLKKGTHSIGSVLYALPDFNAGDEVPLINIMAKPLKVWVGKTIELAE